MTTLDTLNESLDTEKVNLGAAITLYKQLIAEADNFLLWRSEKNINALNAANYCAKKIIEYINEITNLMTDVDDEKKRMRRGYNSFWTSIPT